MAKQLTSQRYILKIHTGRLKKSKWKIKLTVDEARRNQELIALADSQVLRFIDQINGLENNEEKVHEVKKELKELRDNPEKHNTYKQIKNKQDELDKLLFKKDYVCVVIDSDKDYDIVYKEGFYINNVKYRRLLATTGGVKNSTVVFVNDEIYPELIRRIHNDRDMNKEFAPPKLEAYMALSCSASTPVSMPKGIAVVNDCFTKFKEDIIYLSYKEKYDIEPCMEEINDYEFELNGSDGFGLGHPDLMKRWSKDLHLDYLMSACVIRNSFCKGVTACFDFREVGRDLGVETITDVWGNVHNINDIELILTESMLKLWSSYSSIDDYLEKCEKNGYTFSVTKAAVKELENERNMNYQFLQGYNLADNELEELINPTVKEIRDIVGGDYSKLLLYLKGTGMTEKTASNLGKDFTDALMIDKRMLNDPFVKSKVNNMIKKRIDDAKIGVLSVRGAYSIVIGDPYALCEHMFGFEPVGLLKEEEVYSEYWSNHSAKEICCYRAPQTVSNNIRKMNVVSNKKMKKYYRYLHSIMVLNVHDSTCAAMNGMDFDK